MAKNKYLVVTIKSWNIENFEKLKTNDKQNEWHLISDKDDLTYEKLNELKPRYVFFPHWSWIIPKEIYENFECIVFHMTDLPFGRGGSPLQNLISRGVYETKVSAIRVVQGLDAGDVYCKEPLSIKEGNANDILKKVSNITFEKMIPFIIKNNPVPKKQEGEPTVFKRRTSEQSDISNIDEIKTVYDFIRMLDGEGYPPAFIETEKLKIEFCNARLDKDQVIADCILKVKKNGKE